MAIVKVNVGGRDIGDKYTFQILLGIIGMFILLIVVGPDQVGDWVLETFFVWTASTLLFYTLMFGFIHETFTPFYIFMMIVGAVMLIIYVVFVNAPAAETAASVVKALVWAAVLSFYFDQIRKRVGSF